MNWKLKFGWSFFAIGILGILLLFNNCQPFEEVKQSSSVNDDGDVDPIDPPVGTSAGEIYFTNTLKPQLNLRCIGCHTALPKDVIAGGTLATTAIYTYANLRSRVSTGASSVDNYLLNKMRNTTTHGGGNQCVGDISGSVSPCKEAKAWVELEFPLKSEGVAASILSISPTGTISGYAMDPKNLTQSIAVILYVNGPVGTGTLLASVTANLVGPGFANGHYFNYNLPPLYKDGVSRPLYAYTVSAAPANIFPGVPRTFAAYQMTTEGRNFYNANLLSQLNVCTGCHAVNYDIHFYDLLNPTAFEGGTAANNTLINKMSGMNHSGGNHCAGGKNSGRCAIVQQWWNVEFN